MELDNNDEKLNIENTDTIDGMAYEQDTSSLILLLADGMDWSDINRHLLLLQEKLNTYIWYIDSGQYEENNMSICMCVMRNLYVEWYVTVIFGHGEIYILPALNMATG